MRKRPPPFSPRTPYGVAPKLYAYLEIHCGEFTASYGMYACNLASCLNHESPSAWLTFRGPARSAAAVAMRLGKRIACRDLRTNAACV